MGYKDKTEPDSKNRERIFVLSGINRFGERLKVAMNGMSNNELARRSGMSETTIRKYLRGDIYPGIDSAALVAEACGVSLLWLISGIEQKDESVIADVVAADPVLITILQRLPEEQSRILADAIIIHGVSGIIAALNGMAAIDEFMLIPEGDRERVLRLYKQIKEGDSEGDKGPAQGHPVKGQRAG
ncbi:helix-turn-helix domain-containing protein [Yokenella regensburgei]|uniref:helix-turn-helix domain-containing protein n=1 Tax=Yokenella regensburgei TaxID=158877 RepID=UPI003ED975F7